MDKTRGTLISFASAANHGKTTMAIKLYLYLIENGIDVVFVQESIKYWTYSPREVEVGRPTLDDLRTIKACIHRKTAVIYDNSFISPFCYGDPIEPSVTNTLMDFITTNLNQDIYIHIPKMDLPFNPTGRYQSSAGECIEINHRFKRCLDEFGIPYINASFQDQDLLNTTIYHKLLSFNKAEQYV